MPFKIGRYAGVPEKMRLLASRAELAGIRQFYMSALVRMHQQLEQDPLGCGDPLYRLHIEGGTVCHAVFDPNHRALFGSRTREHGVDPGHRAVA